jgi:aminocarboxymuconate-semialdehyde decarboxylase
MTGREQSPEHVASEASGIAFVDCDLSGCAPAESQPTRREVVLKGRHVKTVDVHAHCAAPEALALVDGGRARIILNALVTPADVMDEKRELAHEVKGSAGVSGLWPDQT